MLSIVIIAKNEAGMLKNCLESVKWADEIIVVDNGSTDDTAKIAKEYTKKVIFTEEQNFSIVRNKGMQEAIGDWVLYIDADERVLFSLREEIQSIIIDQNSKSAYAISRKNIIFGKEEKYGPFWPDWVIRLFKKTDFEKWVGEVHEHPIFKGDLGYTKNSFLHLTHRNVDQMILKNLAWSKIDAKLRLDANHPPMTGWRFLRIFCTEMFNQGILRKGFFNGAIGVTDSMIQTFSLFTTYVRLWEIQQPKPLEEVYKDIDLKLKENNFKLK